DREPLDPVFREPERELLVEAVEAADIGKDEDCCARRLGWASPKGHHAVAVRRHERLDPAIEGAAGDRRGRWQAVVIEAHRTVPPGLRPGGGTLPESRPPRSGRPWCHGRMPSDVTPPR